jgi:hypothetical protein
VTRTGACGNFAASCHLGLASAAGPRSGRILGGGRQQAGTIGNGPRACAGHWHWHWHCLSLQCTPGRGPGVGSCRHAGVRVGVLGASHAKGRLQMKVSWPRADGRSQGGCSDPSCQCSTTSTSLSLQPRRGPDRDTVTDTVETKARATRREVTASGTLRSAGSSMRLPGSARVTAAPSARCRWDRAGL